MNIGRALILRNQLVSTMRGIYSTAKICKQTSDEITAAKLAAFGRLPKGTPGWVRQYADGYEQCLRDALYSEALVFGGYVGETFYSTHRNRADYYEINGISPADYADDGRVQARGHYWAHDTTRHYFI